MKTKNKILARLATLGAALFTLALPCRASDIQNPSPATAATTPGGAANSIQFNNGGAFGGFGSWNGTTFTVPGAANSLNFAGSSTGNPVTLTATGSDADIDIALFPKGDGALTLGSRDGLATFQATEGPLPFIFQTNGFNAFTQRVAGSEYPHLQFYKSRGTLLSPTPVLAEDFLGIIQVLGYESVTPGYPYAARIYFQTSEDWTNVANGSAVYFAANKNGEVGAETSFIEFDGDEGLILGRADMLTELLGSSYKIAGLTSNGFVKTSGGDGTLSVQTGGVTASGATCTITAITGGIITAGSCL